MIIALHDSFTLVVVQQVRNATESLVMWACCRLGRGCAAVGAADPDGGRELEVPFVVMSLFLDRLHARTSISNTRVSPVCYHLEHSVPYVVWETPNSRAQAM